MTVPSDVTVDTVIDGFTICDGCQYYSDCIMLSGVSANAPAEQDYWYCGGGIYCAGSVTISNDTIICNQALSGAGIFCEPASSPRITNNDISGNFADAGGGIYCFGSGAISNNSITDNNADYGGGGILCDAGSSPVVFNNVISQNQGGWYGDDNGGGIGCASGSSATISNNTITQNYEGAVACGSSSTVISSNTISDNDFGIACYDCSPAISNNIVAFDSTGMISSDGTCARAIMTSTIPMASTTPALVRVPATSPPIRSSLVRESATTTYSRILPVRTRGGTMRPGLGQRIWTARAVFKTGP